MKGEPPTILMTLCLALVLPNDSKEIFLKLKV